MSKKNNVELSVPGSSFSALLDTTDGLSAEGSIPAYKKLYYICTVQYIGMSNFGNGLVKVLNSNCLW
jgi:hypothetical protein